MTNSPFHYYIDILLLGVVILFLVNYTIDRIAKITL